MLTMFEVLEVEGFGLFLRAKSQVNEEQELVASCLNVLSDEHHLPYRDSVLKFRLNCLRG
jgi:hypothetical protein